MGRIDALLIGAGVVGLAVGRALAQAGRQTIVIEAAGGIGTGVSSRNSEVIHAGLYDAPGSLKARLCVRGKERVYAVCASHGVPHAACGKLVVATAADQHAALTLMLAMQAALERGGGQLALRSPVQGAVLRADWPALVRLGDGADAFEIEADRVVYAAGLHACDLVLAFEGLDWSRRA